MLWTHATAYSYVVDNWPANPVTNPGTTVVPGASNVEGAWTEVLGDLAQDVYGFWIKVANLSQSAQSKPCLMDIGTDPAGGTAYSPIISNIICGGVPIPTLTDSAQQFYFPYFIKAGSAVAARIQTANATPGSGRVLIRAYGQPSNHRQVPVGQYAESIGTITDSNGVAFTPGTTSVDGAWVSLGTTARPLWWWQLGYQLDNANTAQECTYIDLGFGASGAQQRIQRLMYLGSSSESMSTAANSRHIWAECYYPLPAGTEMWIRGRCQDVPDTGYNGNAIGIGG